jgi:hypothetical protein
MSEREIRTKYVTFQILKKINDGLRAKFMNRSGELYLREERVRIVVCISKGSRIQ